MTTHSQPHSWTDEWLPRRSLVILSMDLSHLWVKTKETFICFYMEKLRTQDYADENGRKDAHHCNQGPGPA
jgi:hypothetical protein